MARQNNDDLLGIEGRVGQLTAYVRNGKKYWRVAHNRKTRRLSRKQLAIRERQSHNNALWRALKTTEHVYMEGGDNTTYSHFMSINMESPVPYFTKQQYHSGRALLLAQHDYQRRPATVHQLRAIYYRRSHTSCCQVIRRFYQIAKPPLTREATAGESCPYLNTSLSLRRFM